MGVALRCSAPAICPHFAHVTKATRRVEGVGEEEEEEEEEEVAVAAAMPKEMMAEGEGEEEEEARGRVGYKVAGVTPEDTHGVTLHRIYLSKFPFAQRSG